MVSLSVGDLLFYQINVAHILDIISGFLEQFARRFLGVFYSVAKGKDFLTTREIYIEALSGMDKGLNRVDTLRIAKVMRTLGWKNDTQWTEGRARKGYSRPAVDPIAELL